MNNQVYIKCEFCSNRNQYGFCTMTYCNYTPTKSQTTNEIKQENLIIPCPISNKLEVNKNGN
jgi:hypothetical protein